MAPVAGFWAEKEQYQVWQRALQRLGSDVFTAGTTVWIELKRYPATLLLYALGLGAVEARKYGLLKTLLGTVFYREYQENEVASQVLPPFCLFAHGSEPMRLLEGMEGKHAPLNDWIHDTLREIAKPILPNDSQYTLTFDKLEVLIALAGAGTQPLSGHYWAPPGAYGYRHQIRQKYSEKSKTHSQPCNHNRHTLLLACSATTRTAVCKTCVLLKSLFLRFAGINHRLFSGDRSFGHW